MNNQKSIHDIYAQLGNVIADVMEHPDTPAVLYNALGNLLANIDNQTPGVERQVAFARGSFPGCLSVLTDLTAVPERRQKAARP